MTTDWAMKKARELSADAATLKGILSLVSGYLEGRYDSLPPLEAFAAYIREHEEAPVDPVLEAAREVCAEFYPPDREALLAGSLDHASAVKYALGAIRRGAELAREGKI